MHVLNKKWRIIYMIGSDGSYTVLTIEQSIINSHLTQSFLNPDILHRQRHTGLIQNTIFSLLYSKRLGEEYRSVS